MALPTKILLEVVTPDRSIVREEIDEVVVPATDGYLGVLPGHTPLLATLKVGELWYRQGQEKHYLAIAFGFVEVLPDHVTVHGAGGRKRARRSTSSAPSARSSARKSGWPRRCRRPSRTWNAPASR